MKKVACNSIPFRKSLHHPELGERKLIAKFRGPHTLNEKKKYDFKPTPPKIS